MLQRANVVAIDRANEYVLITPAFAATRAGSSPVQQGALVRARTRSGRWPPPLSKVWVEQHSPSHWEIVDTVTPVRDAFDEDWNVVNNANPLVYADTIWGEATVGVSGVLQGSPAGSSVIGCIQMVTGGANGDLDKLFKDFASIALEADRAYWLSGSMCFDSLTNIAGYIGLTNLAATAYAVIDFDTLISTTTIGFLTNDGVTLNTTPLPFLPTLNTFFTVDIVIVPARFAACWIDGSGPHVSTANLPPVGTNAAPTLLVQARAAAAREIFCDWIKFATFLDPVHPNLLYS